MYVPNDTPDGFLSVTVHVLPVIGTPVDEVFMDTLMLGGSGIVSSPEYAWPPAEIEKASADEVSVPIEATAL